MKDLRLFDYAVAALLVLSLTRPWWEPALHPSLARSYLSDCGVITTPWDVSHRPDAPGFLNGRSL